VNRLTRRERRLSRRAIGLVLHPEQDHGDVVLAPTLVGGAHECISRFLEGAGAAEDARDLGLGDHPCQPVGAEQVDVAIAGGVAVGVHLDLGLGPQRAGDDRALGVVFGGSGGELATAHQLRHQRMVVRELLELAIPSAVRTAVPHVPHAHVATLDDRCRGRCSHARARLVACRQFVDLSVGLSDHAGEALLRRTPLPVPRSQDIHRHLRGHLAGLGAAHAVRNGEQRPADEVVLVGLPLHANIAQARMFNDSQSHRYSW